MGSRSQLSVNTLPAAAVAGGTFEIKPLDADPAISVLTCDSWRISLATEDAEDPLFVDIICGLLALRNYPSTAAAIRDRMVARKRGGDTSSQETLVKEEDDIEVPSETLVEQRIRHHIAASPHTVLSAHGTLSASASSPSSHNAQQGPFYYISQEGVPVGQDLSIVKVPSRHLSLPPMKQAASFDDLALLFSRGRKSTATGSDSVLPEEAMEDGDSDLYKDSSMAEFLLPSGLPSFSFDVSEFEEMIPSPPVTPGPDSLHPNSLTSRGRRLSNVRDPQSLSTDELDSLLGPNSSGEAEGEAEGEEEENGSRRATRSLRKRKADGSSPRTLLKKTVIENISELEVLEQESDEKSQVAKEQIDEEDDEGFTPSSPVIVSRSSKAPTSRSVPSSSSSSSTSTSRIPPLNLTTSFSQERLLQPLLAKVLDEHDIFDFDLMETTINPTKNLEVTVVEDDDDNEEAMSTYNSEAAELASVSAASDVTDTPPNISSLMDFSSLRLVSPARSSGNYVPVWATVLDNRSVYISWLSTEGLAMGTEDSFPLLRRADNDLVNATLILHAVGLSEQVQSVILSLERTRIRCADRKSPLFGVWIPLHRAVELATSCCIEGKMRQFLSKKLKEHFVPPRPVAGVSTRAASAVASQPPPQQPQPVQAPKMEQRGYLISCLVSCITGN